MTHLLKTLSILKYTSIELIDSIVLISAYASSTQNSECAIFVTTTDNVYALGCNPAGHLGVGDFNARIQPTKLPTLCGQNIVFCEIRHNNTTALTKNGEAYIWGDNYYGQIGNGTLETQTTPYKIEKLLGKKVIQIHCENCHVLALTADGQVYAWGTNEYGQVGNGRVGEYVTTPYHVKMDNQLFTQIAVGGNHSLALSRTGLYSWGDNIFGQLGDGTQILKSTPAKVVAFKDKKIVQIACGINHSMACDDVGRVYIWGSNFRGQCQAGSEWSEYQLTPMQVGGPLQFERVSEIVSQAFSASVQTSSGVYVWGKMGKEYYQTPALVGKTIDEVTLRLRSRTYRPFMPKKTFMDSLYIQNVMDILQREKYVDVLICFGGTASKSYLGKRKREENE